MGHHQQLTIHCHARKPLLHSRQGNNKLSTVTRRSHQDSSDLGTAQGGASVPTGGHGEPGAHREVWSSWERCKQENTNSPVESDPQSPELPAPHSGARSPTTCGRGVTRPWPPAFLRSFLQVRSRPAQPGAPSARPDGGHTERSTHSRFPLQAQSPVNTHTPRDADAVRGGRLPVVLPSTFSLQESMDTGRLSTRKQAQQKCHFSFPKRPFAMPRGH